MLKKNAAIIILLAAMTVLAYAGDVREETVDEFVKSVPQNMMYLMSAADLAAGLDESDDWVILDIRPPSHYNNGHIEGSLHIPLTQLVERRDEVPKDKKIAVVCAMDTNSAFATAILRMHGYDAWIIKGGVPGWVMAGMPLVK